jgi:uncharacterized protein YifE (UPF0438 family)
MKNPVMANNAFVKAGQAKMKSKMGDRPTVPAEMKHFDAFMSNNEETVTKANHKLTKNIEDAFPVK